MASRLRRPERVIVISGPTSSGKTTLVQALIANHLRELADRLDVPNWKGWKCFAASKIHEDGLPQRRHFILHYDFLRPFKVKVESYALDPVLRLLDSADTISVVTIWTPPEALQDRFYRNEILLSKDKTVSPLKERILATYRQPAQLVELYRTWLDFCANHFARAQHHWIVEFEQTVRFISRGAWDEQVRIYDGTQGL